MGVKSKENDFTVLIALMKVLREWINFSFERNYWFQGAECSCILLHVRHDVFGMI